MRPSTAALMLCLLAPAAGACRTAGKEQGLSGTLSDPAAATGTSVTGTVDCKIRYLTRLGWTLTDGPRTEGGGAATAVCGAASLEAAKAAGALAGTLNRQSPDLAAELDRLIQSDVSKCAYRIRLSEALGKAVTGADANDNFTFVRRDHPGHDLSATEGMVGTSATGLWEIESARMSMYVRPDVSPSKALQVYYTSKENTYNDCFAGSLAIATLAQMELFTPAHFDRAFRPGEIFIGNVFTATSGMEGRGNPLEVKEWYLGDDYVETPVTSWIKDPGGITSMRLGRHALIARRGAVESLLDEEFLDSIVDINENLIVTGVSPAAEQQMAELARAGVDLSRHILRISGAVWLRQAIARRAGPHGSQYDQAISAFLDKFPEMKAVNVEAEAARLLTDPVLNEIKVWVHPLGTKTIRANIERLLGVNPRMPYGFDLRPENYSSLMYERFRDHFVSACE